MKKPEMNQTWVLHQDTLPQPLDALTTRRILAYTDQLMCVENTCQEGSIGALHCHPHSQIVYIAEGEFLFTHGDEEKLLTKGDTMVAIDGVVHGCTCLKAGVILDIFTPIRDEFL